MQPSRRRRPLRAARPRRLAWRFPSVIPPSPGPGACHHRLPGKDHSPPRGKGRMSFPARTALQPRPLDAQRPTPSCSRQHADMARKPAYAAVAAARTIPQQPSGQPKPIANGSDSSELAASEAANRRMSVDMSGPLSIILAGTTEAGAIPTGERPNKTGVTDTRGFLAWLKTLCPSSLSVQKLMIVPGNADGFRATVGAL